MKDKKILQFHPVKNSEYVSPPPIGLFFSIKFISFPSSPTVSFSVCSIPFESVATTVKTYFKSLNFFLSIIICFSGQMDGVFHSAFTFIISSMFEVGLFYAALDCDQWRPARWTDAVAFHASFYISNVDNYDVLIKRKRQFYFCRFHEKIVPLEVKYESQVISSKDVQGLINFCRQKESIAYGYAVTKTPQDVGLLEASENLNTKIMRIPASIFYYWLGESEILRKSILSTDNFEN